MSSLITTQSYSVLMSHLTSLLHKCLQAKHSSHVSLKWSRKPYNPWAISINICRTVPATDSSLATSIWNTRIGVKIQITCERAGINTIKVMRYTQEISLKERGLPAGELRKEKRVVKNHSWTNDRDHWDSVSSGENSRKIKEFQISRFPGKYINRKHH